MVYKKIADGTEGGKTLAVTLGAAQQCVAFAFAMSGAHGDTSITGTGNRGAGTGADPTAVTASWGTANNLFMAILSLDNFPGANPTPPAGYGNLSFQNSSASGQTALAVAYKSASSASDDPGVWAWTPSVGYISATLVVRPS